MFLEVLLLVFIVASVFNIYLYQRGCFSFQHYIQHQRREVSYKINFNYLILDPTNSFLESGQTKKYAASGRLKYFSFAIRPKHYNRAFILPSQINWKVEVTAAKTSRLLLFKHLAVSCH